MDMQYAHLSQPSGISTWIRATRPEFLTITALAVLLGTAVAFHEQNPLNWLTLSLSLIAAILIHAGADVLNDYYDDLSGADRIDVDRLTPFAGGSRVIQLQQLTPIQMFVFGLSLLGTATVLGLWLVILTGSPLFIIGSIGLVIAYIYSAPPWSLSYRGMGEIAVTISFGILPVLGAYYVQTGSISLLPVCLGLIPGLLTAAILFINQFPDYTADSLTKKRTLVARLGPRRAAQLYPLWATGAVLILVSLVLLNLVPTPALSALVALPLVWKNTRALRGDYSNRHNLLIIIKRTIAIHGVVIGLLILTLFMD